MSRPSRAEREAAEAAARVARRAIRRLDILEWLIYAGAAGLAVAGGGAVAWLVARPSSSVFRATWVVTSLLLFVVPGGWAMMRARRADRVAEQERPNRTRDETDG